MCSFNKDWAYSLCETLQRTQDVWHTISVFLDSQFIWGEKNSPAKKAIIQGSIWWLCTPIFINSVPSKKNYFCCYNQKSNIEEKIVKLGLKGQLYFIKQRNEGGQFKQVMAGAKVQRLKHGAICVTGQMVSVGRLGDKTTDLFLPWHVGAIFYFNRYTEWMKRASRVAQR